jgi:hypothetical protein
MSHANQTTRRGAMALLNFARQYYEGAEIIFASNPRLTNVLYFLYFHTVESLLKAYLKAHGRNARGHNVSELCAQAQQLGLRIEHDESGKHNLHNVVALLKTGNKDEAFRYFTRESRSRPDLDWTRDVVTELMRAVTLLVESAFDKSKSGAPVKFDVTWRVNG